MIFPLERLQAVVDAVDRTTLTEGSAISLRPWLEAALATPGTAAAVPSLNAVGGDQVPDGALVRFCGMIQDVQDPEYYDGMCEERDDSDAPPRRVCGKYRDVLSPIPGKQYASFGQHIWQRTPAVCVPVPSQTEWAASAASHDGSSSAEMSRPATTPRPKRSADDDGDVAMDEVLQSETATMDSLAAPKKTRSADGPAEQPQESVCAPCDDTAGDWSRRATGGVLLKLYDEEGEPVKVHEVVEVYGILERPAEPQVESCPAQLGFQQAVAQVGDGRGRTCHLCAAWICAWSEWAMGRSMGCCCLLWHCLLWHCL